MSTIRKFYLLGRIHQQQESRGVGVLRVENFALENRRRLPRHVIGSDSDITLVKEGHELKDSVLDELHASRNPFVCVETEDHPLTMSPKHAQNNKCIPEHQILFQRGHKRIL